MSDAGARFEKPSLIDRVFNRIYGALVQRGIGFAHTYMLEVRGRKSGNLYTLPVDLLLHDARRYLVAPRGYAQWVRNAEAAGAVRLRKGREVHDFRLRALPEPERPPVLKAYLDAFRREVQRFFPVPAGSPVGEFVPLASRYPAFELLPAAGER